MLRPRSMPNLFSTCQGLPCCERSDQEIALWNSSTPASIFSFTAVPFVRLLSAAEAAPHWAQRRHLTPDFRQWCNGARSLPSSECVKTPFMVRPGSPRTVRFHRKLSTYPFALSPVEGLRTTFHTVCRSRRRIGIRVSFRADARNLSPIVDGPASRRAPPPNFLPT